jgi:Asp-tRNA(Asn)/Glu-tRNA(Gln) amidotransferase A subunit family amidase
MSSYHRRLIVAPRLSGAALRALASAVEAPLIGEALLAHLSRSNGLSEFRRAPLQAASPREEPLPLDGAAPAARSGVELAREMLTTAAPVTSLETVSAFWHAYRSGEADPVEVVQRLHGHIERLDQGPGRLAIFIARQPERVLAEAARAAERWRRRQPLSAFDGVPVVIKDEVDVEGFPTTLGTSFLRTPATRDGTVVARLRAAGALILGKSNMNEIGINPIGVNPHHGACRNPYDRARICGGSSSGSAAAVAAGLAPLAVGLDGGGSIRIPAALCGVVGLKATFGRISEAGVPPLCWTVGHIGPIGLTVADVAAGYAVMAGPDALDSVTQRQSAVHLSGFELRSLQGIRIGVCRPYLEDAEPSVVARCDEALGALIDAGAVVVELPAPNLNQLLWTHTIIILSEMAAAMLPHTEEDATRFGDDTRINLAIGRHFTAADRVQALRHRQLITRECLAQFATVDAVLTPTCATTAPLISERSLPGGESNLSVIDALMRFVRQANVTGLPAISVPAGYDERGLPVGVQLMARPYEEHLLFRLARVVEAATPHRAPAHHVRALSA